RCVVPGAGPGAGVRRRRRRQLPGTGLDGQAGAPGRPAGRRGRPQHRRGTARRDSRARLPHRTGLHRRCARQRHARVPQRQAQPGAAAHARLPLAQAALRGPLPESLPVSGLGPFPMHAVIAAAATIVGWLVVRAWARRLPDAAAACPHRIAVALFVDAVLVGLLAARLGYVLLWWPEYMAAPRSIIAIGDGGFLWWAGLPAAAAFAWWRTGKRRPLRRPLLAGIAAGMLAWAVFGGLLAMMQRAAPPLPAFELATLGGEPTTLAALSGRPMVLNLWATWCPPCRREMPVLADAQRRWPDVVFVLANQG